MFMEDDRLYTSSFLKKKGIPVGFSGDMWAKPVIDSSYDFYAP